VLRTEPLRAMVIGAFVRGLSMRDIEALCAEAGLGSLSKATASRICQELRERYEHFNQRDLLIERRCRWLGAPVARISTRNACAASR
jgi:transposase-like protein